MPSKTDAICSIFTVFASIFPFSSNIRRTKSVDLNQTPHVIHPVHQANPARCAGPACSRQANHAKIQAALLIGHRTKDKFNGSVFGELSRTAELAERLELAPWIYGYWPVAELLRAVCSVVGEPVEPLAFLVAVAAETQSSQLFFIRLTTAGTIGPEST